MKRDNFILKNSSGDDINTYSWIAEEEKAVVHIVHGQNENALRYHEFASFLAENGFSVYCQDLRGHGFTRPSHDGDLVVFANRYGYIKTIEDIYMVKDHIIAEHPGKDIHIIGHSMGSFIARWISGDKNEYKTYTISGTFFGEDPKLVMAIGLAKAIKLIRGPRHYSGLMVKLSTGDLISDMKKKGMITHSHEWLTSDEGKLEEIKRDEFLKGRFSISAHLDLFTWIRRINSKSFISSLNKAHRTLIIAGSHDPLAGYGRYTGDMYRAYIDAGLEDTHMKVYDGYRHEILNEKGRQIVYDDILGFLLGNRFTKVL